MIDSPVCEYICENLRRRTGGFRCAQRRIACTSAVHRTCRDARRNVRCILRGARSARREGSARVVTERGVDVKVSVGRVRQLQIRAIWLSRRNKRLLNDRPRVGAARRVLHLQGSPAAVTARKHADARQRMHGSARRTTAHTGPGTDSRAHARTHARNTLARDDLHGRWAHTMHPTRASAHHRPRPAVAVGRKHFEGELVHLACTETPLPSCVPSETTCVARTRVQHQALPVVVVPQRRPRRPLQPCAASIH